jgi:hypothetical protein
MGERVFAAARMVAAGALAVGIAAAIGAIALAAHVADLMEPPALLACPLFDHVSDALDWFEARGVYAPTLWRGPDGKVRGSGYVRTA